MKRSTQNSNAELLANNSSILNTQYGSTLNPDSVMITEPANLNVLPNVVVEIPNSSNDDVYQRIRALKNAQRNLCALSAASLTLILPVTVLAVLSTLLPDETNLMRGRLMALWAVIVVSLGLTSAISCSGAVEKENDIEALKGSIPNPH